MSAQRAGSVWWTRIYVFVVEPVLLVSGLVQLDHAGKIRRNEVYFDRSDWMTRMGAASKRDRGGGP